MMINNDDLNYFAQRWWADKGPPSSKLIRFKDLGDWFSLPADDSDKILAALDALRDLIFSDMPDNAWFELSMAEVDEPCLN